MLFFPSLLYAPLLPFPLFGLLFSLQPRDVLLHFTQPTSSSTLTCLGPLLRHRPTMGSKMTAASNTWAADPLSLLNTASYGASQARKDAIGSEQEGCSQIGCAATLAPFSPSSSLVLSSSLLWQQGAALSASKAQHSTGLWEQGELQQKVMQNRHKTSSPGTCLHGFVLCTHMTKAGC